MDKQPEHEGAQRFGGEFGPIRGENTTGVSLSTFKTLVWISNIGGLLLVFHTCKILLLTIQGHMLSTQVMYSS